MKIQEVIEAIKIGFEKAIKNRENIIQKLKGL